MVSHTPSSSTPGAAARPRIYWGWWIFVGALLGQFVTIGFGAQVAGAFLTPMTEDLGWERSEYVLAGSVGFAVGGVSGFFIGPLIDRFGPRPLMLFGATLGGAALIATSQVGELWQFVLVRGVAAQLGLFMVGPLVVNTSLSKWFVLRRGQVIALASIGASLAGIIPPIVATRVVDSSGWEAGWVVMGISTWALIYPIAWFMRRQPEDHGWLPDGRSEGDEPTAEQRAAMAALQRDFADSYTRAEAIRTPTLWILAVGFSLALATVGSIFAHAIPFLTDGGFSRGDAAFLFGTQGAFALVSKFFWAWAMQRWPIKMLAVMAMGSMALADSLLVISVGEQSVVLMFPIFGLWGFGVGGMIPITEFIWASYFGRRHIGAVRTTALPITVVLAASGPLFVGGYFDQVGDYDGAFFAMTASLLLGSALVLITRKPPPKLAGAQAGAVVAGAQEEAGPAAGA